MAKKRKKILDIRYMGLVIGLVIFLAITFLSVGTKFLILENLELGLLNFYFNTKYASTETSISEGVSKGTAENKKVSPNIVIAAIDEKTLDMFGRWPFSRAKQANYVKTLARIKDQETRERALLLDIFYNETAPCDPRDDQMMVESIKENGRVFLETILDMQLQRDEIRRKNQALQEILFERIGSIKAIAGNWRSMDVYLGSNPPIREYSQAIYGYGHASYSEDTDQVFRHARLVIRYSEIVEEKQIPVSELSQGLTSMTINEVNFEWIAWVDKNQVFHRIKQSDMNENIRALESTMDSRALRKSDQSKKEYYIIRKFRDRFVPSIVLSLTLEYYNKKIEDVEVRLGEYISIKAPEIFDTAAKKWIAYAKDGRAVTEIKIPIDEQAKMLINFMGPDSTYSKTFRVSPFYYYAEDRSVPPADPAKWRQAGALANKIVIVCAFAKGLDEKMTPYGIMYGGEIHANALNTVIMDNYLHRPAVWVTILIILGAVLLAAFITSRLPPLLSLFISVWFIAVYFFAVIQMFDSLNLILNFSAPAIGIFFTFLAVVAYRVIFEEQDKRRIKSMFTKYVSAPVVEQLLIHPPELGGVDKEISVLFSDIRGYTTLSETMTPQALVNHLNQYLTAMTDLLFEYQGTLDKYVGDMVMGFWGAPLPQPEHALLACKCALRQMAVLRILNESWPPEKRINIGIGINSGIMTVGNMGSPGRMNYTIMGDNVNLGSRLEGTNKEYGTNIIISEYTFGLVRDKVVVRELDNIRVKGKNKPVLIYELFDVIDGLDPPKPSEI